MALETLAEFSPEEILPIVPRKKHRFRVGDQDIAVKTCSLRLQVFKQNLCCVSCGVAGSIFRLQRQPNRSEAPHLNLYGFKEEKWVLMTQDHIKPRSRGGKDCLQNLQTMCTECNERKGSTYEIQK